MNQSASVEFGAAARPRADGVHLGDVWRALRARWKTVVGIGAAAFLVSTLYVNLVTPEFTGEARFLLERGENFFTRPNQDRTDPQPQIDEQAVASQVQVAMSRDLAREAIRRLNLVGNPEFDPLVGHLGFLRQVLILVGAVNNPLERAPEERVLDAFYRHLLVYQVGRSRVVAIEFRSRDPELAARGANTVAEIYLALQETAKKDSARSASSWLGGTIETLRARVAEAENKVEHFRASSGLLVGANNSTVVSQQLSDLNAQLAQARSAKADAEAKAKLLREMIRAGRAFEIPDVANNDLIRRLLEQRVNLRTQLALELRTLMPEHPRIKELNAQVGDLEAQIRGAAERTARTLENEALIASGRVETVQATLDAQSARAVRANESEVQLRALEREARTQREQLESYLVRYREAQARDAENAAPADARIVSRAIEPQLPSFPKKLPTVLFVTLAAFVLTVGAIVGRELLADPAAGRGRRVAPATDPDDAVPETHGSAAFSAAEAAEPGPLPPQAGWRAPPAGAFDLKPLLARLSAKPVGSRGRRVLVTAAAPGDPAGTLAHDLARALCHNGQALLVGLDRAAGDDPDRPGFTDLVMGDVSFVDVIERETGSALHVVGPGLLPLDLLADEAEGVEIAISAFDQTYAWVICHLPDGSGPLEVLAHGMDAVVIASSAEPTDPGLVDLYERAKAAGATDVFVARERAVAANLAA
jgi:polysaccharide biosynthesis transport protein